MPWCPKCKVEYREGFTVCSDCGSALVNAGEMKKDAPPESLNEPVLLMQAADEFEANNVIALLAGEGIPAYLSHKGPGEYLSIAIGMSNTGVNIFVPKNALQQAKEIITSAGMKTTDGSSGGISDETIDSVTEEIRDNQADHRTDQAESGEKQYNEGAGTENPTRVIFARILLAIFILPVAYSLFTYLIRAIQSLLR